MRAKWYLLQPDGAADEPQEALGGRTPLQAAATPNLDRLAATATPYRLEVIPEGFAAGSDVGNMSLLGYDPVRHYTGRAPIEVAAMGVTLASDETAFRCNLVTIDRERSPALLVDFSAGHIPTEEAHELIAAVAEALAGEARLYPGVSYRHILVAPFRVDGLATTPPHDIQGQPYEPHLPRGPHAEELRHWAERARAVLAEHPVNAARQARGEPPATDIWLWGQGAATCLPAFAERHGGWHGAMITAVDLLRGLAVLTGMEVIEVPGATGFVDTNYAGKAAAAIAAEREFVFLHLEAPDESSHMGSLEHKLTSLERFDREIVGPILEDVLARGAGGILVAPDHPTLLRTRTHAHMPVPAILWRPDRAGPGAPGFDERIVATAPALPGWRFIDVARAA